MEVEDEEYISLKLKSFDHIISYPITVKKYYTCSQLIFFIIQVIKERYPSFGDISNLMFLFNGNILSFSSALLETCKIKDGDTILILKAEDIDEEKQEINKAKDSISITLVFLEKEDDFSPIPINVDIHMMSANLINLLNQLIENYFPNKNKKGFFFIHNNKKLIFNAINLKSLNFKNHDKIIACRIEDENIIDDDCNIKDTISKDLISVALVSPDQSFYLSVYAHRTDTCNKFIFLLIKRIRKFAPSEKDYYFIWRGEKLNYSSETIDSIGIKNGDHILAYEIKPLFKENLEMDLSIIIDEENQHQNGIDFNLSGILKLCLIKDMSLYIDKNFDYYKQRLTKKIKYVLEAVSGGNIDLNQTENSIISVLKKFEGINILNFSRFINEYINKDELMAIYKIFKKKEKVIIRAKNNCLNS